MRALLRIAVLATFALCACAPLKPPADAGAGGGGGAAAIDPSRSRLAIDRTAVVADGVEQLNLTATIRDTDDVPVQGARVVFSMTGTANVVSTPQLTGQSGEAPGFASSTRAERKLVTATIEFNGTQTSLPAVEVTFSAGPPVDFVFATQPTTTKAGVVMAPPVKLTVTDSHGNVAPGPLAVTLRLVRSNSGTLTGGGPFTSVDGGVTFDALTINRPQAGRALRAESANGAAIESDPFDVVLGDLSAATSTLLAVPPNAVADGVAVVNLTVTTHDTGDNALANLPVSLSVTGTGNTVGATSGTTDVNGRFSTTLASTVVEVKTVRATVGSITLDLQVTFIP